MRKLFRIRKTIFVNLIVIFVVLNAPLYLMSVYMNHKVEQSILQRSTDAIRLNASYFLKSFETEIERIDNLKNEYLNHDDFLKLANEGPYLDPYSKNELILTVKDKLHILKTSSPFVQDVKVYFPSLNRGVFASSYENRMSEGEQERIRESYLSNSMLYAYDSTLALGGLYPVPLAKDNLAFSMEIALSRPAIETMLREIGDVGARGGGTAILYSPELGWAMSDRAGPPDEETMREFSEALQPEGGKQLEYARATVGGKKIRVIGETSESLGVRLMVTIPEAEITGMLQGYSYMYYVILVASLFLAVLFSYGIYRLVHRPFQQLMAGLRRVEKGDYDVVLSTRKGDEFSTVYRQFNSMAGRIKVLIQEVFEQKIRLQSSELKQLQSQINPHFLYNSYYAIYRLAQRHDVEKVAEYTRFLGDYFKYITRNASDIVPLRDEINHADAYIRIQMLRFSNRIRTEAEPLPEELGKTEVPKLVLQPLIENAYVHGLGTKLEEGFVSLSFVKTEGAIGIVIEDNGELKDATLAELHGRLTRMNDNLVEETTGILNVHKRIQLKYGKEYGLFAERSKLGGLKMTMKLPVTEAKPKGEAEKNA